MEIIIYNNIVFYIKKDDNEIDNMFWERAWFIVKNYNTTINNNNIDTETEIKTETNKQTFIEDNNQLIVYYSKLWQSYKFYNCIYDNDTLQIIKTMENNIHF